MTKIIVHLLSWITWLISLLPFWLLYRISDILYFFLYYLFKYRKKVVFENLALAFPDKTFEERRNIAKKFYVYLADLFVEVIKMKSISSKQVHKRFRVNNPEEIYKYFDQGISVIGMSAHYANWEMAIYSLSLITKVPVLIIYKPLTNKVVEAVYNHVRQRFGAFMVPMRQTLRQILAHKQTPHISMFLSDQTPARSESDYFVPFLGQETLVFQGVEKIAKSTNFPIVFSHINRIKRGYYECTFTTLYSDPKLSDVHEITLAHTRFLENIIKQKPELWLWSHRRWKHKPIR